MTRTLKERTFSGTTNPEIQPWEIEHRKLARLAAAEGVPAYVVFSNATLADMAAKAPHTMEDFLEVSGVGEIKAARYGEAFLKAIAAYEEADKA